MRMNVTRRKALLATGASLGLAGCLGNISGSRGDNPNENIPKEKGGSDSDGLEYEVFQLGPSLAQPLWATVEDKTGFITLLEDEYDDTWMVEDPDAVDGLRDWLDETDLEKSSIVYVETAGPNTCYNSLDITDVAIEDGEIVGTAEAVDNGEQNDACGSAETHPSAFVRMTAEDVPSDATFTVIDGWGESSEVTADGRYVNPENLPGHVSPDSFPPKLKDLTCDDERFHRLQGPQDDEAELGEVYTDEELTFAMRVHTTQTLTVGGDDDSPRVGRGHEVRISLWNVSTDTQLTGNRHKWNLQVLTMDGWDDVRGTTDGDPIEYTDEGIEHRPGSGFEWTIEMTEAGVVAGHVHEDGLEVCPDLKPGRYRFVYRGIVSGEPVAVEFDYTG